MSVLRHRRFAAIWSGSVASNLGMMIQVVGATWLMASLTPSPVMVAMVLAANALPVPLLALLAGALADLHDRRTVLISAQLFRLVVSATLTVVTVLGLTTEWVLVAVTFLLGCGAAINQPAWHASVGDQVPREDVPDAVALNSVGFNIGRTAGPAIGGLIVTLAGAAACFMVNTVSNIGLLVALASWRPPPAERRQAPQAIGAAMREGVQYVCYSPIRNIMAQALIVGFCGSAIWALIPLVARDMLHAGAEVYGLLLGGFGLGAVVAAMFSGVLRRRIAPNTLMRGVLFVLAAMLLIVALSRSTPLSLAATFVAGGCWVTAVSNLNITVQMSAARWVVARALALYQTAIYTGMALGGWAWGTVAEAWGLPVAFESAAALLVAGIGLMWTMAMPSPGAEYRPARAEGPVATAPLTDPGKSAIVVLIEYRVAEPDAPAFQRALREKRRIRLRDGARRWSLAQDAFERDRWIEQYVSANWADYHRQRFRPNLADAEVEARVLGYHRGETAPTVRRMILQPGRRAKAEVPVETPDVASVSKHLIA